MIYEDAYDRLSRATLIDIDGDVFIRQMDAAGALRINPDRIKPVATQDARIVGENMGRYRKRKSKYIRIGLLPDMAAMYSRCRVQDVRRFVRDTLQEHREAKGSDEKP